MNDPLRLRHELERHVSDSIRTERSISQDIRTMIAKDFFNQKSGSKSESFQTKHLADRSYTNVKDRTNKVLEEFETGKFALEKKIYLLLSLWNDAKTLFSTIMEASSKNNEALAEALDETSCLKPIWNPIMSEHLIDRLKKLSVNDSKFSRDARRLSDLFQAQLNSIGDKINAYSSCMSNKLEEAVKKRNQYKELREENATLKTEKAGLQQSNDTLMNRIKLLEEQEIKCDASGTLSAMQENDRLRRKLQETEAELEKYRYKEVKEEAARKR